MQWHEMDIDTIISGVTADKVSYLQLFLIDYKQEFNVNTVNPSCIKCLKEYHNKFVKKFGTMSDSIYKLLHKREGIQLEFGSNVFVTNKNITDEYAKTLIARYKKAKQDFKLSDLFEIYPTETEKVEKEIVILETEEVKEVSEKPASKPKRNKRK